MTAAVDEIARRLSNWGRWGADDQAGTLNHITEAKRASAASLIRTGRMLELSIPVDREGPQIDRPRRFNPIHFMNAVPDQTFIGEEVGLADDVLILPVQAGTQWDALAHVSHRGRIYNGRGSSTVTVLGAEFNSIAAASGRVATRGVFVDVARHRGVESLEPGHGITPAELEEVLAAEGVDAGEGDVLIVRTGFLEHCRRRRWKGYFDDCPGLALSTLDWIQDRRLAAVASDNVAVEAKPSEIPGFRLPFHVVALVYMGLLLGEVFELEGLSRFCAETRRYEFFFVAAPLLIPGGIGSPINPCAIF